MLVTFKCKACGNVMMFGDVAKQMLRMMGHSENVPGAIEPEDIAEALEKLTLATEQIHQSEQQPEITELPEEEEVDVDDLDVEPVVSLYTRATPLIDLLKAAEKAGCYVMWE
ncbi:DUF1840 domain-containing protein [Photobacterium nomapromontoriensis]|uniref:DUF1840 domain-containing protein n=1 Tax=Photobacterium nomapromontoriensis TaxID=2910237 RepID=UPI003D128638